MLVISPILFLITTVMLIDLTRTGRILFHEVPEQLKTLAYLGIIGMVIMSLIWTIEEIVALVV